MVIIERANRIGQNGNNIIAIIGKPKQIRLMFHLKVHLDWEAFKDLIGKEKVDCLNLRLLPIVKL